MSIDAPRRERLVLALVDVMGFTRACAAHGDEKTFAQLRAYYALVGREVGPEGRVVKLMGDAVLLAFPTSAPSDVVRRLATRDRAADMWRAFEPGCDVAVKAGIGEVLAGPLGIPGNERPDLIGAALNALVKAPWGDFDPADGLRELPRVAPR